MSSAVAEHAPTSREAYMSGSFFEVSLFVDSGYPDRNVKHEEMSAVASVAHPLVQVERSYDLRPYLATLKYLARRPELIGPALGTLREVFRLAGGVESMTAEYDEPDDENAERLVLRFRVCASPDEAVRLLDELERQYLVTLEPSVLTQLVVSVLPA